MTARPRLRPSPTPGGGPLAGRSGRWPGGRWTARLTAVASGAVLALAFPGPAL